MTNDNLSFFEKLTGNVPEEELEVSTADEKVELSRNSILKPDDTNSPVAPKTSSKPTVENDSDGGESEWLENIQDEEGQLTVDVYQTPTHIVVQAPMAGVKPDDVDVSINNDMIIIRGKREAQKKEAKSHDYYYRELFWGAFSRSILLPEEVDSDKTEASFKTGLLTVSMPKIIKKEPSGHIKVQTKEI